MKKLVALLFITSSALAGSAGHPLSEGDLLSQYHTQLAAYAVANKASLPQYTDCLKTDGKLPQKPAGLKLVVCGIAKEDGHLFVDVGTASAGLFSTPEPFLLGDTPRQRAVTELTVRIQQFKMRHALGQVPTNLCAPLNVAGQTCRLELKNGTIEHLYYQSKDGIRLMYDGKSIKDSPKP